MNRFLSLFGLIGLLTLSFGSGTPTTPAQLGEKLFFDPILSADSTVSCASCHIPQFAFSDTSAFSRGVGRQLGRRNTQGITNMAARPYFFFDGRAATLEHQVLMPVTDSKEMASDLNVIVQRLREDPGYHAAFSAVYQAAASTTFMANALAAYVNTLETSDTPFDRWMNGDPKGMSNAAIQGRAVFMNKGKCFDCHFSPDFTGDEFRNVGLFTGKGDFQDQGRFEVTKDSADLGKFKVPGLRNVAMTAPFMHNGMFQTLEEVIDFYDHPDQIIVGSINRDTLLAKPLGLTREDKANLKAFLEALTDDRFIKK